MTARENPKPIVTVAELNEIVAARRAREAGSPVVGPDPIRLKREAQRRKAGPGRTTAHRPGSVDVAFPGRATPRTKPRGIADGLEPTARQTSAPVPESKPVDNRLCVHDLAPGACEICSLIDDAEESDG